MVYFISGHRGCGKSFVAKQIKQATNCNVFDTGPIVRAAHKHYASELSFAYWLELGEAEYGKDFTNQIICNNINIDKNKINIIIGNRTLTGIKYITDHFGIENYKVCFIDGDIELFRKNYNSRESLNFNFEEFNQIMQLENMMGIGEIENFVKKNPEKGLYFYKKQNDSSIFDGILNDINLNIQVIKQKKKER